MAKPLECIAPIAASSTQPQLNYEWISRIHQHQGNFLPSDILQEHAALSDWSVHPNWKVTSQLLPGSQAFATGTADAAATTRLIFPRWIRWEGVVYEFDAERSYAPSSEADALSQFEQHTAKASASAAAAAASASAAAAPHVVALSSTGTTAATEQIMRIRGSWGIMVFYTNRDAKRPRTLAMKMCHRQARQIVETSVQMLIRHLLKDPKHATFADSFMLPMAIQFGDALVNTAGSTGSNTLIPTFAVDRATCRPKRRRIAFVLCEAMDMDLFASCTYSTETLRRIFPTHTSLMLSQMRRQRKWKAVIFRRLCKPLHFMHRRNLVHADVKPENFLLQSAADPETTPPRVQLCDFDTTVRSGFSNTFLSCLGTEQLYSPERWRDYRELRDLRDHHRHLLNEYDRAMRDSHLHTAERLAELKRKSDDAGTRVEQKVRSHFLPWLPSDDIWSLGITMMTVLTERLWETSVFQPSRANPPIDIRAMLHYYLQQAQSAWQEAFPAENANSMADIMFAMLHPNPNKRILLPPFARKPDPVTAASSSTSFASASATRSSSKHPQPQQKQLSPQPCMQTTKCETPSSARHAIVSQAQNEAHHQLGKLGTVPTGHLPDQDSGDLHSELLDLSVQAAQVEEDGSFAEEEDVEEEEDGNEDGEPDDFVTDGSATMSDVIEGD
jgi:serine/threonine protein kinase